MTDDTQASSPNRKARAKPLDQTRAAKPVANDRADRLKAALKANLARRKAQSRARRAAPDPKD